MFPKGRQLQANKLFGIANEIGFDVRLKKPGFIASGLSFER
jgi:hypothetical protein